MSLNTDQVRQVARLARLEIKPEKLAVYATQLSNILEMVERLSAADTSQVKEMAHPLEMSQRLRPDAVSEADERELFQEHAPATQDGLYLVPKVIE